MRKVKVVESGRIVRTRKVLLEEEGSGEIAISFFKRKTIIITVRDLVKKQFLTMFLTRVLKSVKDD